MVHTEPYVDRVSPDKFSAGHLRILDQLSTAHDAGAYPTFWRVSVMSEGLVVSSVHT